MFSRNPAIFASKADDEVVMLDEAAGLYFALNPVASKIWDLLAIERSLQTLISALLEIYEVSPEQCAEDVMRFLEEMQKRNLICVV